MDRGLSAPDNDSEMRLSGQQVLSIGTLNRQVATLLGRQFPMIWVRGEVSNLTRAASGHCYFSLKDNRAQARAVLFRSRARAVEFDLRNGLLVEAQVSVSLYEPRGDFQLNVERMRLAGVGDLNQQFLALKERLQQEGLFDEAFKRPINPLPFAIGVVTSLQAAALKDVLAILLRRAPQVSVIVYPAPVQGHDAAERLTQALQTAAKRAECSTILLVRGGGSLEDLWSFNDERLARAIRASPIPVVVGVGHESDISIADFAADLRAPTPTAAASLATTDYAHLQAGLSSASEQLRQSMRRRLEFLAQRVDTAARLLPTPMEQWYRWQGRLEKAGFELRTVQRERLAAAQARLALASRRVRLPATEAAEHRLQSLAQRLHQAGRSRRVQQTIQLDSLAAHLDLVDPAQVVKRGYAVVRTEAGALVTSVTQVKAGAGLSVDLSDGQIKTVVQAGIKRTDS